MPFLEDMEIKCPDCEGSRFSENVLNVKYEGYTISDVLNLTVDDALVLFQKNKTIAGKLTRLSKIGLGYLVIGQSTSSLSGGEIQRLKLAKELMKSGKGHTVYLLDEPTTGLHACDIQYLMDIFNDIVSRDNTVMVIEHNLDIICNCDCLVDLGPEGGELGGELVALGTPAQLANQEDHSFTGKYIRRYIDRQNTET